MKIWNICIIVVITGNFFVCETIKSQSFQRTSFTPGLVWNDTGGNPINAHGGGIIYVDGVYYWYGEHKIAGRSEKQGADGGVHCYASTDLYNWKDAGIVLSVDYQNAGSDIAAGCILERPKVVYNTQTRMYVMYFKLYPKGTGYDTGYVGVATSTSPGGPFTYQHKFLGAGSPKGSGDFCMYKDKDGAVYHFTVRKPDKAFCNGRLRSDYLYPEGAYRVMDEIPLHTEAPAIVNTYGEYFMIGSGSSGWSPNAARSFSSVNLTEGYTDLGNPCMGLNPNNQLGPEKTFGGQISFILPVEGKKDGYIAMFDIWNPDLAADGRYIWLPLRFRDGKPVVEWIDEWDLSIFDERPVPIIFDTDCGPDYDDLGALAFLHCAASKGDAAILATVVSNRHELSAPCLQAINTYYGRPDIPIGAPKNNGVNIGSWENWLDTLYAKYPHAIDKTSLFPDATAVYREVLAKAGDHSIVIVTTGFFTNLMNLLQSPPDQFSPLTGVDLVRLKVKKLVSMAGEFPTGFETNIKVDSKASKYAIDHWPTPIVFSGAEVGRKILTGLKLIHEEKIVNHPVKDVYQLVMTRVPRDQNGRSSYDQTAVMYAIYGGGDFFDLEQGRFISDDKGNNSWEKTPSGKHHRLILKTTEAAAAAFIEEKMMCLGSDSPCGTFDLSGKIQPAPHNAIFRDDQYFIWCASVVRSSDGIYHMYYSRWKKEYGFNAWVTHSEVAHATANHPLGPFKFRDVALPARGAAYWDGLCTHNPTIHYFNNRYHLYYTGNTGDGVNMSGINFVHRNNQRIGVAVADTPDGPWIRSDTPLIDVSSDSMAYDALMMSNPSIALRWDGTYILIYKAVGKQRPFPFGGPVVHLAATSTSPSGPFMKINQPLFISDGVDFPAEDPYIWVQDNCFYAIVKDMQGNFTHAGQSLALFTSTDGLTWSLAKHALVSALNVEMNNGQTLHLKHLERPQLYLENGKPTVLYCAADSINGLSFNIHIPLK